MTAETGVLLNRCRDIPRSCSRHRLEVLHKQVHYSLVPEARSLSRVTKGLAELQRRGGIYVEEDTSR
jgi:hypothetical protein